MALTDGLAAYWKLDEAEGAHKLDSTDNGHIFVDSLSAPGEPPAASVSGKINNAVQPLADGSALYTSGLTTPNAPDLRGDNPNGFAVQAWVRRTIVAPGPIISNVHRPPGSSTAGGWSLTVTKTGNTVWNIVFEMGDESITVSGLLSVQPSAYILASLDPNAGAYGTMELVVGRIRTVGSTTRWVIDLLSHVRTTPYVADPNYHNVWLGKSESSSPGVVPEGIFPGYIDEVAIWSRFVSLTEATALANGGNGAPFPFVPISNYIRTLYPARLGACRLNATRLGYVPENDSPAAAHGGPDVSPIRRDEWVEVEIPDAPSVDFDPWKDIVQ